MTMTNLTKKFIRQISCPNGKNKTEYFDRKQRGFLLEVRASGGQTYYQRYTDDHGKKRQYKIGPADIISLDQARQKAKSVLAQVLLGDDPQAKRREKREILTLAELVREHYLPHVKRTKRSWKTDEVMLRLHILPEFGNKPIDTVTPGQVGKFVLAMSKKGYAAGTVNRAVILLRYIYNLAFRWKISGANENPTAGIPLAQTFHRERFLTSEEVPMLVQACNDDENQLAARAIILLLLTGARRNEVTQAKWQYIDWDRSTLLVPMSKSGKPRQIVLNVPAIELLNSITRLPENPYIFPSKKTGRPPPSIHSAWVRIRDRAGLSDFRLHDLRHSFSSFLVNRGTSLYVLQHLLGHTQARTTQRYAHLEQTTLSSAVQLAGEVVVQQQGYQRE